MVKLTEWVEHHLVPFRAHDREQQVKAEIMNGQRFSGPHDSNSSLKAETCLFDLRAPGVIHASPSLNLTFNPER